MKTNKIIGIAFLLISLYIGYHGINKVSSNSAKVAVLGLEINASNDAGKEEGYLYIGIAIILFAGGIFAINKK